MTTAEESRGFSESRFYESYTSTHAGIRQHRANHLIYRRDIRPHVPASPSHARVLDIGCGQGDLVRLMLADGLDAYGVDISPEQVEIARTAGLDRVELGDFQQRLTHSTGTWDAVVATDLLEHLHRDDLARTFDNIRRALRPGGVFIARVPNAVSPTGGHIMYGDITHQCWFTHRSIAQIATVTGFVTVNAFACPPPIGGLKSAIRTMVWCAFSGLWKLALIAETGQVRGHIVTQNLTFVARTEPLGPPAPGDAAIRLGSDISGDGT